MRFFFYFITNLYKTLSSDIYLITIDVTLLVIFHKNICLIYNTHGRQRKVISEIPFWFINSRAAKRHEKENIFM